MNDEILVAGCPGVAADVVHAGGCCQRYAAEAASADSSGNQLAATLSKALRDLPLEKWGIYKAEPGFDGRWHDEAAQMVLDAISRTG